MGLLQRLFTSPSGSSSPKHTCQGSGCDRAVTRIVQELDDATVHQEHLLCAEHVSILLDRMDELADRGESVGALVVKDAVTGQVLHMNLSRNGGLMHTED